MKEPTTYVGIDAHQRELRVAMLIGANERPVQWTCPNEPRALERLCRKLKREAPGALECCYEAGPTGYTLQRLFTREDIPCRVIAPSMVPRKPGDRVKTDRRDAAKLAHFLRAGLLTDVYPPTSADEAVRDLCRARDQLRSDLMRCRHRLGKLLVRRGLLFHGRNWTTAHREWLRRLEWTEAADRHVVGDYQLAIEQIQARLREFDRLLGECALTPRYARVVATLRCFRGIETVSAMTIVSELHAFRRFPHPRALMAYVGLVPSEDSTGDRRRPGAITKTGNLLVRRILVEIAWHYRHAPWMSPAVRRRRAGQPPEVVAIATRAEQRLCRRYRRLSSRGKPTPTVAIAVARELVGFLWAALQVNESPMLTS
jgi:transposase